MWDPASFRFARSRWTRCSKSSRRACASWRTRTRASTRRYGSQFAICKLATFSWCSLVVRAIRTRTSRPQRKRRSWRRRWASAKRSKSASLFSASSSRRTSRCRRALRACRHSYVLLKTFLSFPASFIAKLVADTLEVHLNSPPGNSLWDPESLQQKRLADLEAELERTNTELRLTKEAKKADQILWNMEKFVVGPSAFSARLRYSQGQQEVVAVTLCHAVGDGRRREGGDLRAYRNPTVICRLRPCAHSMPSTRSSTRKRYALVGTISC